MLRILFYLLLVVALGLGFAWLADRPGDLVVTFAGQRYGLTLMAAAAFVVAIVVAILIVWWLIKSLVQSPYTLRRHFRARKRDRGYQSLSTGLIAAGAGDSEAARRMTKQAGKLLNSDQEPLIKLLEVQTAMLEGRADDARAGFEAMLEDPETKLLGLRGLYIEAQRVGAREAARHYAAEAAKQAPQLEWASSAVLGQLCGEGDWDGALKLVEARKQVLHHSKDVVKKERAALLTAKAMAVIDTQPLEARSMALEAHKLAPDLVPTALIAARALFAQGDVRKGSKILEAAWKRTPHPDVAAAYVHARIGDTAIDRLKRARHLMSLRTNNVESSLAVAQAAFEAGDYTLAREQAQSVLKSAPRESAYLLMADIEEAETGDQGRVRQWLAQAVKAPRDPAWTADGFVSEEWSPVSPVSGRLNSFEWKVPVEQLAPMIEAEPQDVRGPSTDKSVAIAPPVIEAAPAITEPVIAAPELTGQVVETVAAKPAATPEIAKNPDNDEDRSSGNGLLVVDDPGVHPDKQVSDQGRKTPNALRLF